MPRSRWSPAANRLTLWTSTLGGQVSYSCPASGNSTLQVNVKGNQLSLIVVTFVTSANVTHLLYNSTVKSVAGTFPSSINGTFLVQVINTQPLVNKISGSVTVSSEETEQVEVPIATHPYMYYGAVTAVLGGCWLGYQYWKGRRPAPPVVRSIKQSDPTP